MCLSYSHLAALCLSISKEPLHSSSLFESCTLLEERLHVAFSLDHLVRLKSPSLQPLTHSLIVYSEEPSASSHVSQQSKSQRGAKSLSGGQITVYCRAGRTDLSTLKPCLHRDRTISPQRRLFSFTLNKILAMEHCTSV